MSRLNKKGQALVETLFSLPVVVIGVSATLTGLHSLFLFYLCDHWVYESALCLAQEQHERVCKQQLTVKLHQLPFCKTKVIFTHVTPQYVRVKVEVKTKIQIYVFDEKISKSLTSNDFGRAL